MVEVECRNGGQKGGEKMRLIDADKFEAVLICGTEGHEDTFDDGICYMLNRIDEAPTIEAEPVKHGHWVTRGMFDFCSCCDEMYEYGSQNYCPNCGAKMDKAEAKKTV